MKFTEVVKAVRADGMKAVLLRGLFMSQLINIEQLGKLAERFGDIARSDGLIIRMDNPLLPVRFKGTILMGWYENDEREMIQKNLPDDEPVIELGASIGVVACIANRRLRSPDQHVVVEASPELIPTLKKNRDLNSCQFTIIEAAIAYGSDSIAFFPNGESLAGSIYTGSGQKVEVPAKTLQAIAENANFHHFNLICDIEGSEIEVIDHEIDFIREHVGLILIETHYFTPYGEEGVNSLLKKLATNGFEIIDSKGKQYCFRNRNSLEQENEKREET
ncbi:MAG TPA: FkbM family methyltransferase [Ktedonobacteraceae bacterium]|nr:FkbM family methyltransferase [Ktedonobacteraceae bacterium]